jgi:hypothetical protein
VTFQVEEGNSARGNIKTSSVQVGRFAFTTRKIVEFKVRVSYRGTFVMWESL